MDKRAALLSLLDDAPQTHAPAAFFMHFPPAYHAGEAAVRKHIQFYRATGMDLVKIQYEAVMPPLPDIQELGDWRRMPCYGLDFYAGQLAAVEGLVQALKAEALVLVTLYSPFMAAGHTLGEGSAGNKAINRHLREDPEAVRPGLEAITASTLLFVRECLRLGVDGFYASTQGAESNRFADPALFRDYIRPYDLVVMREIAATAAFNILHVCDYHGPYDDLAPVRDYPGHVVNLPNAVGGCPLSPSEGAALFARPPARPRPYMGGLDRHGVLASGQPSQVYAEAQRALAHKAEKMILAADCTVPAHTPWNNLKAAVDAAHAWQPEETP